MRIFMIFIMLISILGCSSMDRGFSSCCARNFGADWVVVQYDMNGQPIMCWKLKNVSLTSEDASDGIYWKDSQTGNLVHISGWYNFVQVNSGYYEQACAILSINCEQCTSGRYKK